jgi:RHS repeat-associated protein
VSWSAGGSVGVGLFARRVCWVVVASVGLTWGLAAQPVMASVATAPASPRAARLASSPDLLSARVAARAQGSRVEVLSKRTETTTTFVNPDGSFTSETYGAPVRIRDKNGKDGWSDVDLNLVTHADGTVGPKVHPQGLVFGGASGAGGTVASLTDRGGRTVELGWAQALPKPTLNGTRATYAVSAGVDLVQEAIRMGVEQFLLLKDRAAVDAAVAAAASTGGVYEVRIPVRTKGLTGRAGKHGAVDFVDAKGKVVQTVPAPSMWDAATNPRSGLPANTHPVSMRFVATAGQGRGELVMGVDPGWLSDPARVLPVTIDPTTTYNVYSDTWVENDYTTAQAGSTELRVGSWDGGAHIARTYLTWDSTTFKGASVSYAELQLHEYWSYSCSARNMDIRSADPNTTSTTWTSQPGFGGVWYSPSFAHGFSSSCNPAWVQIPVTGLVQAWAGNGVTLQGMALMAQNEYDSYGWKRFESANNGVNVPKLVVTYNHAPTQTVAPTVSNQATYVDAGLNVDYTPDAVPTFTTHPTDADGSSVMARYEVHTSTTTSSTTLAGTCDSGFVASGAAASCSVSGLTNGAQYYVRALPQDSEGRWSGSWSPWETIRIAASSPATPTVTCAGYADGSWTDLAPAADVPCSVTVPQAVGYNQPVRVYAFVDGATWPPTRLIDTGGHAGTFTGFSVPKSPDGRHEIKIATQTGSNLNAWTSAVFGWGHASMTYPSTGTATTGKVRVVAGGPPRDTAQGVSAKLQWRVHGGQGWTDGPALALTNPNPTSAESVGVDTTWDASTATREAGASADVPSRTPITLDVQVCFAYDSLSQCTAAQSPVTLTRLPHAFGNGYPTASAGPGQVALFTGELATDATDVSVPGYSSSLSIGRSQTSFSGDGTVTGWPTDPASTMFGPGWTANVDGPDAGAAGMQVLDNTSVDGTILLLDGQGIPLVFANPNGRGTYALPANTSYTPITQDTITTGATLTVTGAGTGTQVVFTEADGTVTTYAPPANSAPSTSAVASWTAESVSEPGQAGKSSFTIDGAGRVTRIVAAAPPGLAQASCPTSGTLAVGCRAVDITYGDGTSATANTPAGQVWKVTAWLYDPATSRETSTVVATYLYDGSKRLVQVSDPRTGLATAYTWDGASTRLASVTAAGQAAYRFSYDTATKVKQVTRDPASTGGASSTVFSVVYGIDPTIDTTGLPALKASDVQSWWQAKAPKTGYAVFGPDHPVTGDTPAAVTSSDWAYADLSYVDDLGYTVNTAGYGAGAWQVSATDYTAKGNVSRTLGAAAVNATRGQGLSQSQVDQLSTQTTYNTAETAVATVTGPQRLVTLATGGQVMARSRTTTLYDQGAPSGNVNPDTNQAYLLPTTVTIEAVTATGTALETTSVVTNSYDPLSSTDATEGSGWKFRTPVKVSTGTGSGAITRTARIDSEGRVTDTRQPLSTGTDAGTTKTVYYTVAANGTDPGCGGKAQWAGLACHTYPAAAPSSGPSLPDSRVSAYSRWLTPTSVVETSGAASRTTTTTVDPVTGRTTKVQTTSSIAGSTDRPAVYTHYDPATGLVDYTGPTDQGTAALADTAKTTVFDLWARPTTTRAETTTPGTYDVTVTGYDAAGRVSTVTDPKGTTTYAYDGTDAAGQVEHRGLVTGLSVSRANGVNALAYSAAYDADGHLTTQKLPGAITQRTTFNEVGQPVILAYSGQVTPVTETTNPDGTKTWTPGTPQQDQPWLTWATARDNAGRTVSESTPAGAGFDGVPGVSDPTLAGAPSVGRAKAHDREYSYDQQGRLTSVADRTASATGDVLTPTTAASAAGPCTVRAYGFDANGRRTSRTATTHTDGVCAGTTNTTVTSTTYAYDSADRPTTSGAVNGAAPAGWYGYDSFGRQTTIPAADAPTSSGGNISIGYFTDDLARTITQGTTSTTFTLDSAGRRLVADTTSATGTKKLTRHYTGGGDNPSWTDTTTTPTGQSASTVSTRYASSIGGDLGADVNATTGDAQLTLANPHGDVVTTIALPATQSTSTPCTSIGGWSDTDEYGNPKDATATAAVAGDAGYGWLGGKQRSTTPETAGLTLMGDRLYNANTGRFTSLDPTPGGNENAYSYPFDPINTYDLTGHQQDRGPSNRCRCTSANLNWHQFATAIFFGAWQGVRISALSQEWRNWANWSLGKFYGAHVDKGWRRTGEKEYYLRRCRNNQWEYKTAHYAIAQDRVQLTVTTLWHESQRTTETPPYFTRFLGTW